MQPPQSRRSFNGGMINPLPAQQKRDFLKKLFSRISEQGLMIVLLLLSGFAMWSAITTSEVGTAAIKASTLADDYVLASRAVAATESLERKYRLEPGPESLRNYRAAVKSITTALDKIEKAGSLQDRQLVESVRRSQDPYLDAALRMFKAIDRHDTAEVERIDNTETDPRFSIIEKLVNEGAANHQKIAIASLENLRERELFNANVVPIVFVIGVLLSALFTNALRRTRRQLDDQRKEALRVSQHDALTGLPNRVMLNDRFTQALQLGRANNKEVGLLLIDLDRFKEVNDNLGHHYGDELLTKIGIRLSSALREGDTVARLGGDEFGVLLPVIENLAEANAIAHRLQEKLRGSFEVFGVDLDVEASIGVAISPLHGEHSSTLMQHADIAMYEAKASGIGVSAYEPENDQRSPERLALLSELRLGIERGELFLEYQPKVSLSTGQATSVEALLRWNHPVRGRVPPGNFIPFAEHTGIISALTSYVLDIALMQVRKWKDEGIYMPVAVNISARNLSDTKLVLQVAELLRRYELLPEMLILEVTESAIMVDSRIAHDVLTKLHQLGIKISIDDFGAGYTSLAQLKNLPISELKIDKVFILAMQSNEADALIIRSVINLGHNLGMTVVAEGVENGDVVKALASYECDVVQGYHLCRPVGAEVFAAWRAASNAIVPVADTSMVC